MPYIRQEDRDILDDPSNRPTTPGELNYRLTKEILRYLEPRESYTQYNDVMGVLACIQQELYRRMIAVYEDSKIQENGEVYT